MNEKVIQDDEQNAQYLTFFTADERYVIDIRDVEEIIETGQITRVPMMPDYIRGVMNLRGNVVPVVDLAVRFGKARSGLAGRSCIVLVDVKSQGEWRQLGLLIDDVNEILEIPASRFQPPPDFGSDVHTGFIRAMVRVDDVFAILLAVDRILSLEELGRIGEIVRQAAPGQPDSVVKSGEHRTGELKTESE